MNNKLSDLLAEISDGISDEDFTLATYQGLIAAEITMKRVEKKMNQTEFAKFMGVTQGMVSKWEKGETNFTLGTLVTIATKLGIMMQCPFVARTAPLYSGGSTATNNNITPFPNKWKVEAYDNNSYQIVDSDLKEM